MMKRILLAIVIICLFLLGAWKYAHWYADQKLYHFLQVEAAKKSEDQTEKIREQAKRLFELAMHYYKKNKPQPYLSQEAFFKYIDHPQIGEDEIVSHVKQLVATELVDVNAYDQLDQTALFKASSYSEYSLVKLLLDNGAHINQYSQDGTQTPLFAALLRPDVVKLLLQHEANPNLQGYHGSTVLMAVFDFINAAYHHENPQDTMQKAQQIIELLLAYGADTSIKNKEGKTVFDIAKESQQYFKAGKRTMGDQELTAHWANTMTDTRKMIIQSLDDIEHILLSRGKVSSGKRS